MRRVSILYLSSLIADPLYGIGFSNDARHAHRVALTSFNTGPSNKLTVVDLAAQHQSGHQQGYGQGGQDFTQLASANLAFPATKVAWEPSSSIGRHDGGALLATTGDVLRIWELTSGENDPTPAQSRIGYGSRNGYDASYKLSERSVLSNVSRARSLVRSPCRQPTRRWQSFPSFLNRFVTS